MSCEIETAAPAEVRQQGRITGPLTFLFATAVGIIVTNLFAPQTLVALIGPSLDLDGGAAGLVAMATLLGYAAGLFLLVPLADVVENRALVLRMLACAVLAASIAAFTTTAAALLVVLFALGAACSAIQILVPIAASLAPPACRGRVIGDVMSGLMIGILLARPLASLLADAFGWRSFYALSASVMATLALMLGWSLPARQPQERTRYPVLVASLWHLLRNEPVLRSRALTAALAMAAFSLFWTAVALRLADAPFGLDQRGIALFALVGAAGALVTPLVGRAGDHGWTRAVTVASHLIIVAAFGLAACVGSFESGTLGLVALGVSAVLLDVGVTADQTLGRRAVNLLGTQARGRLNGLFVGLFFLGGALGSGIAGLAWTLGGWPAVCAVGAAFGIASLMADRRLPAIV